METDWLCGEKVAAIAAACVGVAIADPGTIAGGAIAGAGLLGLWNKARLKDGVGSEELLKRVRKSLRDGFMAGAEGNPAAEADIRAADKAMERHLANCVPPIEELAKTTYDDEDFPAYATRLIVDRLAEKDAIFSETSDIRVPAAREFALLVVHRALVAAKSQDPFMQRLVGEVVLLIPQHLQRIEGKVDAGFARQEDHFAELKAMLSGQLGIPIEVLAREIAGILDLKPAASHAELYENLRGYKEKHDELAAQLDGILVIDNRIAALKADAEVALAAFDHDAADRIFGEMRAVEDERIVEGMRRSAEYADGQARARMLKRDWRGAADVWMDAARKLVVFDRDAAGDLSNDAGLALYEFDEKFGDGALGAAIAAFLEALEARPSDVAPVDWAKTQSNIGNSLRVLGERLNGQDAIDALGKAVAAFQFALEVLDKFDLPADRALVLNNLGLAFFAQGARVGGERGIYLLGQAVFILREAARQFSSVGLSVDWAKAQSNLGNVLTNQGQRVGGDDGRVFLQEAVAAHRSALKVLREEEPKWAMAQNNLGNATMLLAGSVGGEEGVTLINEAIECFQTATENFTVVDAPFLWSTAQVNLAQALLEKGEIMSSGESEPVLSEAISVCLSILQVCMRIETPILWAKSNEIMGLAHIALSDRRQGDEQLAHLRGALAALKSALGVYSREDEEFDWARVHGSLGRTCLRLAQVDPENRCEHLLAGKASACHALAVFSPAHTPGFFADANEVKVKIEVMLREFCSGGSLA